MENLNSEDYLNANVKQLLQQLDSLEAVPGLAIESGLHHKVVFRFAKNFHEQTPDRVKLQEEKEEEKEEDDHPDDHQVPLKKEAEGEFAAQIL